MKIHNVRHEWPEKAGFILNRPHGPKEYIFLHYFNPVDLLCNNGIIRTNPHACIIVSPDKAQWFRSEQKLVHDWFHFTGDVESNMQKYNLTPDTVYYPYDRLEITGTVRKMESEFFTDMQYSGKLCELYIEQIFIMMARSEKDSINAANVKKQISDKVEQVRRKMFTSPAEDWPVARMAKLAGLSESRFYTVYKSVYKITPNRDLIIARIEKARTLLQTKDYSVNQVAEMLGYSSVYHFIRQFKSVTGVTPGSVRK